MILLLPDLNKRNILIHWVFLIAQSRSWLDITYHVFLTQSVEIWYLIHHLAVEKIIRVHQDVWPCRALLSKWLTSKKHWKIRYFSFHIHNISLKSSIHTFDRQGMYIVDITPLLWCQLVPGLCHMSCHIVSKSHAIQSKVQQQAFVF